MSPRPNPRPVGTTAFFGWTDSHWWILIASVVVLEELRERDVRPILTKQCMDCRGGLEQKGGLDPRTLPSMLKGGDAGPAGVASRADESELWIHFAKDDMPKGEEKIDEGDACNRFLEMRGARKDNP